jgi:hypothetical protein
MFESIKRNFPVGFYRKLSGVLEGGKEIAISGAGGDRLKGYRWDSIAVGEIAGGWVRDDPFFR